MVRKNCEYIDDQGNVCESPLGDVHGNRRYCVSHQQIRRNESRKHANTRYRDKTRGPKILDSDEDQNDLHLRSQFAPLGNNPELRETQELAIPAHPDLNTLVNILDAFTFGITQRITENSLEIRTRLAKFEDLLDEIFFDIHTNPKMKAHLKDNYSKLQESMRLIEVYERKFHLHQIRVIIADQLGVSDREAEELCKKAHHRILTLRQRSQKRMDDFDVEGAS